MVTLDHDRVGCLWHRIFRHIRKVFCDERFVRNIRRLMRCGFLCVHRRGVIATNQAKITQQQFGFHFGSGLSAMLAKVLSGFRNLLPDFDNAIVWIAGGNAKSDA